MKIITASSFWIFGLAVILNSIVLSLQSGNPELQGQGSRGHGITTPHGFRPGPLPFRKVRCPTGEQVQLQTSFMMKDANGIYGSCTEDKILLAVGSVIVGFILDDTIQPIAGMFGTDIIYDESTDRQHKVGTGYLREHFGVFGPVPEETLRQSVIHPFGMFSSTRPRSPIRPSSPTLSHSASESGSDLGYDTDSSTSSSSSATSRSSSRSSRSFFSRIFSRSSSRSSRPPSSGASSPGKK